MSDLDGLRSLYSQTAPYYEPHITPVFAPLVRDLAEWINRCAAARLDYNLYDPFDLEDQASSRLRKLPLKVADIGTGTGILARTLAPSVQSVIGIDLSPAMLMVARETARQEGRDNLKFLQADLHHLPLKPASVQLIVSSFGLNASTPKQSLRSLARMLRHGEGMLAFQEWGVEDDCSRIVDEAFADHVPDEIPGVDEALEAFYAAPKPWYDHLQDTEDYYSLLKQIGFDLVWVKESAFVSVHLPSVDMFIRYKMAWPIRRLALAAMTPVQQIDFNDDLHNRLRGYVNADGSLDWLPMLFRVFALL
ncbi:MAG: methyltransferase domain-containing protein [Chloroflexota bacterium]